MKKRVIISILISILLLANLNLIISKEISILASVKVNPAYDLSIDIDILNEKISPGENLSVFIDLKKTDLTNISEEISVDLNYEIAGERKGKIIESGFLKSVNITDEKQEIVLIQVSSDLRGRYILKVIASNPQSNSDKDGETFKVRKKGPGIIKLPIVENRFSFGLGIFHVQEDF